MTETTTRRRSPDELLEQLETEMVPDDLYRMAFGRPKPKRHHKSRRRT